MEAELEEAVSQGHEFNLCKALLGRTVLISISEVYLCHIPIIFLHTMHKAAVGSHSLKEMLMHSNVDLSSKEGLP